MNETKIIFAPDIVCTKWDFEHTYDYNKWFDGVRDYFLSADEVIANLETPLAGRAGKYTFETYSFNTPDRIAAAMKQAGITYVATANNHALDRGINGLKRTISVLDKENLGHTGTFRDRLDLKYDIICLKNGVKLGIYATTYGTNAYENHCYLRGREKKLINMVQEQELHNIFIRIDIKLLNAFFSRHILKNCQPVYERTETYRKRRRNIQNDLSYMKKESDFLIVLMHDGSQFQRNPLSRMLGNVSFFEKCGTDVVLTNHEHIVSGHVRKQGLFATYAIGDLTGAVGVEMEPKGKGAEFSVAINLYLKKDLSCRYTFTIIKKVSEHGCCKPYLLSELYDRECDPVQRRKLYWQNIRVFNNFMGTHVTRLPVQREYIIGC